MSHESLCKLCVQNLAVELDLETSRLKSVNKLMQRLFECYSIDISIVGDRPCICDTCFGDLVHLNDSLEKWSKAQRDLKDAPLEIDDSQLFQVKEEPPSSDSEMDEESETSNTEVEFPSNLSEAPPTQPENVESLNDTPNTTFAAGIGRDGLVLVELQKDQSNNTKILCTCCNQIFDFLHQVRIHTNKPRTNPEYMCRECGVKFHSAEAWREHHSTAKDHSLPHTDYKLRREVEFWSFAREQRFQRYSDIIKTETILTRALAVKCATSLMHSKFKRGVKDRAPEPRPVRRGPSACNRKFSVRPHCTRGSLHSGKMHDVGKGNVCKLHEEGEFISLPMELTLQPGKYISLNSKVNLKNNSRKHKQV